MTLKRKRRDNKAEVRAWLEAGNKGTVGEVAHALDMPEVSAYSALVRLEGVGCAVRKRGAVRARDRDGRPAPNASDLWMGTEADEADEARRGNLTTVQRALAARPALMTVWMSGSPS